MPTKKKPLRELPKVPQELLKQFSAVPLMTAEAIEEASAAFKKALIERALNAELG
ncbi:IS256 family transposase, partial [Pseudomonas sp. CrR7]|nr:IS256 family transposase [Pseudomonas sp. CM27]